MFGSRKKLEARKMLVNRAESPASSAHFVRRFVRVAQGNKAIPSMQILSALSIDVSKLNTNLHKPVIFAELGPPMKNFSGTFTFCHLTLLT